MKKNILVVSILVVSAMYLRAQTWLDTLYEKFPNYHYNWYDSVWDHPLTVDSAEVHYTGWSSVNLEIGDIHPVLGVRGVKDVYAETAVAFIPDSSMRLVGVAFGNIDSNHTYYNLLRYYAEMGDNNTYETAYLPECYHNVAVYTVNVYDKNMNLLQSVSEPYISTQPPRHLLFGGYNYYPTHDLPTYYTLREIYLDYPMVMTDTFYVSRIITYNDTVRKFNENFCSWEQIYYKGYPTIDYSLCLMPWEYYRYRDDIYNGEWQSDYTFGWQHAAMYPIVENPGDSCPQVHGVEVLRSGATQAFLMWQDGTNHRRWQVAYGPAGTPPEDCTVLDYDRTMSDLITLDPDSHYVAYVRAFCRLARDEWGPWSDPAPIWLNDPTGIDGVALPEVTLTPNPARGTVTVASGAQLLRIEVYDPQGRLLRTVAAAGTATTLDLAALPPAVYTLIIHTAAGAQTRKLTVAR